MDPCNICKVAKALVVIGAINWGLIGLGALANKELNIVHGLVGQWPTLEALVYLLVGISGVGMLIKNKKCCGSGKCKDGSCDTPPATPAA